MLDIDTVYLFLTLAHMVQPRRFLGSADGQRGCLIRSVDGRYMLRIYKTVRGKRTFTDYDLYHSDLWVTIDAKAMAGFYAVGKDRFIDHAPQVLGLTVGARGRCRHTRKRRHD